MEQPLQINEIFLKPGDFHFGERNTRIRTLLGSCVSITLWHPQLLIGGMCHYMLPSSAKSLKTSTLDGRYGDQAMEMFLREMRARKTSAIQYEAKVFGGSAMFMNTHQGRCSEKECSDPLNVACTDVSCRNQRAARLLLQRHGFAVKAENLGGTLPHSIVFELWSGHVWTKVTSLASQHY